MLVTLTFYPFPTIFSTIFITNFTFSVSFILFSENVSKLDWFKIVIFGKELELLGKAVQNSMQSALDLTLSQVTNFGPFQTERVCK